MDTSLTPQTIYLIRIDDVPEYVGKTGQTLGARFTRHKNHSKYNPSTHWSDYLDDAVARRAKVTIEPLEKVDITQDASEREEFWIQSFKNFGGLLQNRFVGKHDPRTKRLQSASCRGQVDRHLGPGKGVLTPVPVQNLDTGEIFESVSAAARSVGTLQSTLSLAIANGWKCRGYRFAKLTN